MRDNVRKNLKRMEEQLLMETSLEEEFGDWLKEEEEPEEDWLADARELLGDAPSGKKQMFDFDAEDEADEDVTTVYAPAPGKKKKTKAAKKAKAKKEKGVGGLVFLACLELIGIGAVVVWWLLWLL